MLLSTVCRVSERETFFVFSQKNRINCLVNRDSFRLWDFSVAVAGGGGANIIQKDATNLRNDTFDDLFFMLI